MTADPRPPEAWLYFALAVVGGYGDAASVVLAKTFTGHVTGSLVLAAIALAAPQMERSDGTSLGRFVFLGRNYLKRADRTRSCRMAILQIAAHCPEH